MKPSRLETRRRFSVKTHKAPGFRTFVQLPATCRKMHRATVQKAFVNDVPAWDAFSARGVLDHLPMMR